MDDALVHPQRCFPWARHPPNPPSPLPQLSGQQASVAPRSHIPRPLTRSPSHSVHFSTEFRRSTSSTLALQQGSVASQRSKGTHGPWCFSQPRTLLGASSVAYAYLPPLLEPFVRTSAASLFPIATVATLSQRLFVMPRTLSNLHIRGRPFFTLPSSLLPSSTPCPGRTPSRLKYNSIIRSCAW